MERVKLIERVENSVFIEVRINDKMRIVTKT